MYLLLPMTPATTARSADDGKLAGVLRRYLAGRKRAAARRSLVAELHGLDDACLADIGLKRWQRPEAADRFGGPKGPSLAWLVGQLLAGIEAAEAGFVAVSSCSHRATLPVAS